MISFHRPELDRKTTESGSSLPLLSDPYDWDAWRRRLDALTIPEAEPRTSSFDRDWEWGSSFPSSFASAAAVPRTPIPYDSDYSYVPRTPIPYDSDYSYVPRLTSTRSWLNGLYEDQWQNAEHLYEWESHDHLLERQQPEHPSAADAPVSTEPVSAEGDNQERSSSSLDSAGKAVFAKEASPITPDETTTSPVIVTTRTAVPDPISSDLTKPPEPGSILLRNPSRISRTTEEKAVSSAWFAPRPRRLPRTPVRSGSDGDDEGDVNSTGHASSFGQSAANDTNSSSLYADRDKVDMENQPHLSAAEDASSRQNDSIERSSSFKGSYFLCFLSYSDSFFVYHPLRECVCLTQGGCLIHAE